MVQRLDQVGRGLRLPGGPKPAGRTPPSPTLPNKAICLTYVSHPEIRINVERSWSGSGAHDDIRTKPDSIAQ